MRANASKKERAPRPLKIVGDGAISSQLVGDGRLIPILIVDTATRPDVEELVRVHEHISPGDCSGQWARNLDEQDQAVLVLKFSRPIETTVAIAFDMPKQSILVDMILISQALYFQPGRPGDRPMNTQGASKILVEATRTGFEDVWEKWLRHSLKKMFRKEGLSRPNARYATEELIRESRKLANIRLSPRRE